MVGLNVIGGGGAGGGSYNIIPMLYDSVIAGGWAYAADAAAWGGGYFRNSVGTANLDGLRFKAYVPAGTYTFIMIGTTANDCPIMDIQIDGTSVGTGDYYSAGTVYNVRKTITGVAIAGGIHNIDVICNGKNGASAGYLTMLQGIVMYRTA